MSLGWTIAAVIVTYNRCAKLARVLDAVLAQDLLPDRIFVIDNASTDATEAVVAAAASPLITYVRLPVNSGGAGGFAEGIKIAYRDGFDYFWLMDDDGYPEAPALAVLKSSLINFEALHLWKPAFACSMVKWIDGSLCEMNTPQPEWDWPRFYSDQLPVMLVKSCSFVSVLVPSWVVRKHGLPFGEYFIWYDDAEYTQRLAQSYPGLFCPRSITVHDTPDNKGVNYGLVSRTNLWKFLYGARNESSFKYARYGLSGWFSMVRRMHMEMRAGGVAWGLRLAVYQAAVRGVRFRPVVAFP